MTPRLSILLPTHNRLTTLRVAIESLLAQSFRDWELLVVGDGCTDDTAQWVSDLQHRDPRVVWFDLPKGLGFGYANRNVALQQARGDLIGFMADDDIVFGEHLARLVDLMQDETAQLGVVNGLFVDDAGAMIPAMGPQHDKGYIAAFMDGENRLPAMAFVHRRAAFDTVGMWDESLPKRGDLDMWQRIIRHWGPGAVRSDSRYSCVHFRAPWRRQEGLPSPHDFVIWQELLAADRLDPALRIVPMAGQTPQETLWARLQVHPEAHHDLEQAALRSLATFAYATMESLSNLHRAFGTHLERFAAVDAARQAAENRLKASRPKTAD